jgi:hypothetical protein
MRLHSRIPVRIAVALALPALLATPALARDANVVPGLMGPNALPTLPVEDAVVGDDALIEVVATTQFQDFQGTDTAFAPYFRIVIPFRAIAALEIDGTPVEWWQTSPEVQASRGAANASGVAKGDLRFGAKFNFVGETEGVPAISLRFFTKTTTGKSYEDRRFTNGPGYMVDALVSKTLLEGTGTLRRLRLLTELGFVAWQQGTAAQDDAFSFGAAIQARFPDGWELEAQIRGYVGWQTFDKPVLVGMTASYRFDPFRALLTVNRGITGDAPAWEIRAGFEFSFAIPFLQCRPATE